MKRVVAIVAILALVLLGLGGAVLAITSGGSTDSRGQVGDAAGSGADTEQGDQTAPDPALQEFYDQRIDWESCKSKFQCGTLAVPLDYADPTGKTIELNLLMRPADDQGSKVGPLVVNPGGPGQGGTSLAEQADLSFGEPLLESFDVVGFDPRGTGESAPVDCLSDTELDTFVAADPTPDTADERKSLASDVSAFGAGCATKSPEVSAHISTVEVARDMDVLRGAMRRDRLDYFGYSYGTKLGATYADLFPETSGRLVLDGAVDLSLDYAESNLEQAGGFETALTAYVEDCVEKGDCYLGKTAAEGQKTIQSFLTGLDRKPITVGARQLTEGTAFYGIALPLYSKDYWILLDDALERALAGDGTKLLELADYYSSRGANGYEDNSMEAIWAINCLDDPSSTPLSKIPGRIKTYQQVSPTFGEFFAWGEHSCAGLKVDPPEQRAPITGAGADPLLVVGTSRDPATPYAGAESMAEQLESAILVRRDGDGHTAYNSGDDCIDETIESYLVDGEVPDEDFVDCGA
ncbi:MAG TPA: alpha/beta hydrolase [Nocardioides sp.]